MNAPTPPAPEPTLPAGDPAERLRRLWDEGRPPELDAFFAEAGPLPPEQMAVVLRVDQRGRWQAGDPVPAEDYLARYPAVAADPDRALDLVYNEFLLREARGDCPPAEEYARRFPQQAELLRMQIELHRAVAADGSAGDATLCAAVPDTGGPARAPGEWRSRPEMPGYEMLSELGRGGMGVVYKARQKSLNRVVALKMLLAGAYADPEQHRRLRAEAEAVARLRHPNIVQIYEVGEHDGRPYLVLEYVEGGSLDAALGGTPQNPRAAATVAEALARAVNAAHQQGVVHRDLKPANVLLAACGVAALATPQAAFVPKIADFGLAKQLDADLGRTPSEAILGTPSYMAPEQASGKTRLVGPACDVYALGAILYELLTGRPPFRGETSLDTLQQVLTADPVPPRALQPKVPRDLETVCLKCLQKDPGRRYASAADLADDLRRFLAGEPIHARPVGPAARLARWGRRQPAVAGLLAALAVVVVAAVIGLTGLWLRADRLRREAEDNLRDARENFQLSLDAVDQLGTDLSEDPRLQEQDLRPLRQQLLRKVAQFQEVFVSKRHDDPEILAQQARASLLLGQLTAQIESKQRAIDYFLQARGVLERLRARRPDVPAHTHHLARCLRLLGGAYADTGRKSEARAAFEEARDLAEGLAKAHADVPDYRQEWAAAHTALGRFHDVFGPAPEAEAPLRRAIAILDDLTSRHADVAAYRQDLARSQALLGHLYDSHMEMGHWRDARPAYEQALAAQKELVRQNPRVPNYRADQARYLFALARWHRKADQKSVTEGYYQQALAVQEPLVREHPSMEPYGELLGEIYIDRGITRSQGGAWGAAKDDFQKALAVREALAARDPSAVVYHSAIGSAQGRLADVALNLGDPSGAVEWSTKAIAACEEARRRGPGDLRVADALSLAHDVRAKARTRLGDYQGALGDWDAVLAVDRGHGRPWYRLQKGLTLARLGRHEQAAHEVGAVMGEGNHYSDAVTRRLSRDAADVYAVAAAAALHDDKRPEAERYAAAGVASLRRAVQNGYDDLPQLDQDKDLDPLRAREDFKALRAELRQKSNSESRP